MLQTGKGGANGMKTNVSASDHVPQRPVHRDGREVWRHRRDVWLGLIAFLAPAISDMFCMGESDDETLVDPRASVIDTGGAVMFVEAAAMGIIGMCALRKTSATVFTLTKIGEVGLSLGAGDAVGAANDTPYHGEICYNPAEADVMIAGTLSAVQGAFGIEDGVGGLTTDTVDIPVELLDNARRRQSV